VVPMVPAQDFKRVHDGDRGPNTGGMGSYAPLPDLRVAEIDELCERAVLPVVHELRRRGIDYRGVLFAGLMLTADGPRVLEYNVRFGDPEAQVVLPLVREDLVEVLLAVAEGRLARAVPGGRLLPAREAAVCVVMAAGGYPGSGASSDPLLLGSEIVGLGSDGQLSDPVSGVTVVHAGTRSDDAAGGRYVVGGGRVLGITATASTLEGARERAYAGVARVTWPGAHWRSDIAARAGEGAGPSGGSPPHDAPATSPTPSGAQSPAQSPAQCEVVS
ncbi:MAG: phosphoribosylamine--glycine ligase, partial [Acidimicrobiales bacterium]